MPFKTAVQARWNAVRSWRPDREKRWHYVFMLFSWACFIFACWRTCQVVYGRMYYLLDSDMSSELVLSHLLRQEHKIVTQDWFYSTELRVFNIHWAFTPLFFLFDNWLKVRQIGTFIVLALMVLSCLYFCWQAGIRQLFPLIAAVMMTPVSDAYFRILLLTISYPPYITATFFTMGLLFRYMKTPCRRTRVIQLMIITAFAVLLGTNGLRQLLILYLPLFLGALLLAVLRSPARQGDTLPELDLATGRMLFGSTAALLGAGIGWQINAKVLRHIYHYTSQEGVQFKAFEGTRLERLLTGWLESFGYQDSGYITSTNLFYNVFCFLALLVLICAFVSLVRRPQDYTLPEKLIYVMALIAFVIYHGLYLFTDMVYYTRYNIPIVVLMMPVAMDYLYRLPRCRFWRGACIGMMAALLLWCGNDYYTKLWPRNMTSNHEEAVAALRVAGYTEGYATFWNGNIMVELSNGAFDIRVWNPGEELQDPDNVYQWLQETDHVDTHPEGPVFVFLERHELQDILGEHTLDKGTVEFENENYIAYGYPSYDEMRADFFD